MKKIVVLSGAGISAESGLPTFRGEGGMWNGIDVSRVATARAWEEDPAAVLEFYNRRRAALKDAVPNDAHRLVAELERWYDVTVVTQNIDDLHERAGSTDVIHLHGELTLARPEDTFNADDGFNEAYVRRIGYDPISLGDTGGRNREQMRPHVVLFGEPVPKMGLAALRVRQADMLLIVGTSLQVEPAASLYDEVPRDCKVFVIDPEPSPLDGDMFVKHFFRKATDGMRDFLLSLGHDVTTISTSMSFCFEEKDDDAGLAKAFEAFYVLDDRGRCLSKTTDCSRVQYWYDSAGRVERRETVQDGALTVMSVEYDGDGYPVLERLEEGGYETVVEHLWSSGRRKEDIRREDRVRYYYRPDGRIKHMIKGWYPPYLEESFYKWDGSGDLKGIRSKCYFEDKELNFYFHFSPSGKLEYLDDTGVKVRYAYQYDPSGNWIRREARTMDDMNLMVALVERTIKYGKKGFSRPISPELDMEFCLGDDLQLNDWMK